MGFPVPNRPYALLIGAHENDLNLLSGIEGLKDKLSLGFLEMTTDLVDRLPHFLQAYDVVVLGDGSFQYAKSLVDELIEPPSAVPAIPPQQKKNSFQGDFFIA
jgi:Pyrimidine 5'-nucleotidase (UMPH-1)